MDNIKENIKENIEQHKPHSKNKSLINILIKFVLPLALGVAIIYFLMRDVDLAQVWHILKEANWGILFFSLLFGLIANIVRGYRWQLLIKPLGYSPNLPNLIYATLGGYAVNFALPRAGEVWKCGILAKEEKIPFGKLFGTMILDRVMDTLTVLFIIFLACVFNLQFFVQQLNNNQAALHSVMGFLKNPLLYIVIVAGIVAVYAIFKYWGENKLVKAVKNTIATIWKDVKDIWGMKTKNRLLMYTIAIWGCYFLYFYITFFAFGFTQNLGVTAGLTAFALSSLSMGIPSNGGLGPWQVAVIASLALYGVDKVSATAFATGVFTLQALWVIVCGLFGIAALSIKNRHNR